MTSSTQKKSAESTNLQLEDILVPVYNAPANFNAQNPFQSLMQPMPSTAQTQAMNLNVMNTMPIS